MAEIEKINSHEVHILFNAKDHVLKNVTKNFTCDDIIKSLHQHINIEKENLHMYALYESMHGVDRELSGETKIHKLLKAWGSNKDNVRLVVRRKSGINMTLGVSAPNQGHHKHRGKYCLIRERDSFSENGKIRRLSRIVHLQRQRMRSIMESYSSQVPPQEANICHFKKMNPSRANLFNDLSMQNVNIHRRLKEQERYKKVLTPKIPDPVHGTLDSERNSYVITIPEFTAVKFANSKSLKKKHANEITMPNPTDIGTRPPCIGQVDPESFGHNHSRIMGDGEYSYYIEEAYGSNKTEHNCLFFLDRSFRSENYLGPRPDCPRVCSALDIGFLAGNLHSHVNQNDTENGLSDSDKDYMHKSKTICKFMETSLSTEIPSNAKNYLTKDKYDQQ